MGMCKSGSQNSTIRPHDATLVLHQEVNMNVGLELNETWIVSIAYHIDGPKSDNLQRN